jgi:DNA-binding MarR family transcriptional regulator
MDLCLNLSLRKASRVMTQIYDDYLSVVGLRVGQFSILRATHFTQPTTNSALQEVLVLDQTTLTRNLKPLIRDGYIQVRPSDEDKRVKELSLSETGEALYQKALPLWQEAQSKIKDELGESCVENLLAVSSAIVDIR